MINGRAKPNCYHMTRIARGVVRGYMIWTLPLGNNAVMTADAGANHLGMINAISRHRFPQGRKFIVTEFASVTTGYVCC